MLKFIFVLPEKASFCQSKFWHLRTKSALIFLKWLIQRYNIPHFKGLGMRNLQYEKKIAKKCMIQAQWQNIFTIFLSGTDVISDGLTILITYVRRVLYCYILTRSPQLHQFYLCGFMLSIQYGFQQTNEN